MFDFEFVRIFFFITLDQRYSEDLKFGNKKKLTIKIQSKIKMVHTIFRDGDFKNEKGQ